MKRLAWALAIPALSGCFLLPSGEATRVEDAPEKLKRRRLVIPAVPDRHPYGDVGRLRPGQWARYREGERTITLAVAARGPEGVWVEVVEEGDPRQASARLVSPGGVILKAYYGEVSAEGRSAVEEQPLQQSAAPPAGREETGRETGEETVTVAGRTLKARRVRVRTEDLEGRIVEEITLWHPDVPPVYAGSDMGGLVRRLAGGPVVELEDWGQDARPLLELPRPPE